MTKIKFNENGRRWRSLIAYASLLSVFSACYTYNTPLRDYNLHGSLFKEGFHFYRDSQLTLNNKQFYKFKLNLIGSTTYFEGYLNTDNNHFTFFYPDINQKTSFSLYNKDGYCDSAMICFYVVADSTYSIKDKKEVCRSGIIVENRRDTVFRMVIRDFSLLREGDNLALYFSKRKGIVGWASLMNDGNLLYYKGNVYSDSLKLINKLGKKLE